MTSPTLSTFHHPQRTTRSQPTFQTSARIDIQYTVCIESVTTSPQRSQLVLLSSLIDSVIANHTSSELWSTVPNLGARPTPTSSKPPTNPTFPPQAIDTYRHLPHRTTVHFTSYQPANVLDRLHTSDSIGENFGKRVLRLSNCSYRHVGRSVVIPSGGVDKRRQFVPTGLLHYYVQRLRMVRTTVLLVTCDVVSKQCAIRLLVPKRFLPANDNNSSLVTISTQSISATVSTRTSFPKLPSMPS